MLLVSTKPATSALPAFTYKFGAVSRLGPYTTRDSSTAIEGSVAENPHDNEAIPRQQALKHGSCHVELL
jgi:hypothetical protein